MADRTSKSQSLHDAVEEAYVNKLEKEGWEDIWAHDIDGYGNPTDRSGHIPDIAADNGNTRLIVEIETDTSDDSGQRKAFKNWAQGYNGREYRGILAESENSWSQFESA